MQKKKFWNVEKLIGLTAILISIGSLIIIIYQTNLMRKQQYASVLPYLELANSNPNENTYKLFLINNGVGPAFVDEIKMTYEGITHVGDPHSFYQSVILPKDTISFGYSNLRKGSLIPAENMVELITVSNSKENADKMRNLFGVENVKIQITYSSIYGEIWQITGQMTAPDKLN